jgi:zinc transporter ZupT
MIRGGFSKRSAFVFAFLAAAVTTPLGTVVSYPVVSEIQKPVLGALLSLSAGALVYVGATHLLPRAEHEPRRFSLIALVTGIMVAVGIIASKG